MYIRKYIHIHRDAITVIEKEAMCLKESREAYMGEFEGRKEKCNSIIFSKIKKIKL